MMSSIKGVLHETPNYEIIKTEPSNIMGRAMRGFHVFQ